MSLVEKNRNIVSDIIDYLNSHPDFFRDHPDLLTRINIPHIPEQEISSLIEYQVHRLRQLILDTETKLQSLEKQTDINSLFIEDVLGYSLSLYECENIETLFNKVDCGLKQYYSADRTALLVFPKPGCIRALSDYGIKPVDDKVRFMFTELFHRDKPLCDSLQEEHLKMLFGEDTDAIRSTVLLPLQGDCWQALLVLGSHNRNSYRHGIELEMLIYISNLIQRKLNHFIE